MLRRLNKFSLIVSVLIFLVLCKINLSAQQPNLRNYTVDNGLPASETYMTLQDKNGYIWLATTNGVSRFDGCNFVNYTKKDGLTENVIFELFQDYKGRIWFISNKMTLSYWHENKIHQYKYNKQIASLFKVVNHIENRGFFVDSLDNVIFSIAGRGAFKIDNSGNVFPYKVLDKSKKYVYLIKLNEKKYICALNIEGSDSVTYDWGRSLLKFKVIEFSYQYHNRYLLIKKNKHLLFSTGQRIFEINGSVVKSYIMPDNVISIDEDKNNNIWVGLRDNGALCFKKGDLSNSPYLHILKGIPVANINCDNEGGLWFSTLTNGLFYTPSLNILSYKKIDGLVDDKIVNISLYDSNTINIFFRSNAYNALTNKLSEARIELPDNETLINIFKRSNGDWFCTNKSVYLKNNRGLTNNMLNIYKNILVGIPPIRISNLFTFKSGELILGDRVYLYQISNNSFNYYYPNLFTFRFYNYCYDGDNKIFFSSNNGPGYIFSKDSIYFFSEKFPELNINTNYVLYNSNDSSLWVATKENGIYVIKNEQLQNINVSTGLAGDYVYHLNMHNNRVWASTSNGISRILLTSDYKVEGISNIYSRHGLLSNDVFITLAKGDTIYAASEKGLSFFNSAINTYDYMTKVKITGIKVNERDTLLQLNYKLPYNTSTILISYKYLSYLNAGKHIFIYRLKGLSDIWQTTNNTEVRFTTLPPGEYEFEVKVIFDNKLTSLPSETLSLTITPPYWKTWWFILLSIFIVLGLFAAVYFYRVKSIIKQNELKYSLFEYQRKALSSQMNPHFIFNSLNSIQLFILKNDPLTSNKYLSKFASLMRSILNNSEQEHILLDAEIQTIKTYVELEQLRFSKKFDFVINIDKEIDVFECEIPSMLIQPFVENAIWHGLMNKDKESETGILEISISPFENYLKCIICDNGVGREKAAEIKAKSKRTQPSLGAKITEQRLLLLNKIYKEELSVTYTDLFDKDGNPSGTKVELNIPLKT
jgi:ligand-binding sensor domain-containing protein